MELNEDFREAILRLVETCKKYQVRALSINEALLRIADLPPTKRTSLTMAQIEELVSQERPMAQKAADQWAAQLEYALAKDKDVLDWLRAYSSAVKDKL
jgi:predicted NBD/HSP70 family sugar kinase